MTKTERDAISVFLDNCSIPNVPREQIDKLDSADFKLGWKLCHALIAERFQFLRAAKASEIRRFARTGKMNPPTSA